MNLKPETRNNILKTIEITLGISYEEFEQLDSDEQQKLIAMHKRILKRENSDEVNVLVGPSESSFITKVKKGERIMVGSGENSCFVRAGISPQEELKELNNKIDTILYEKGKPIGHGKKLQRRIKNK